MNKKVFYIVDVFAENKYEGNRLAVVRDAADIPDKTMQRIAREMHFSETTFILFEEEQNARTSTSRSAAASSSSHEEIWHDTLDWQFCVKQVHFLC